MCASKQGTRLYSPVIAQLSKVSSKTARTISIKTKYGLGTPFGRKVDYYAIKLRPPCKRHFVRTISCVKTLCFCIKCVINPNEPVF
jgi:hypothetical protein